MAEEKINRLRQQIFDFYSEVDPSKLRQGLDVNGMALWTQEKGKKALNELLMRQYGSGIDFQKPLETPDAQVDRFSSVHVPKVEDPKPNASRNARQGLSYKEESELRDKMTHLLEEFFAKHDPAKANDEYVRELVEVGMIHGEKRLNADLLEKYGFGLHEADSEGDYSESEEEPDEDFNFDDLKIKQELRIFYQKHDPPYLEEPEHVDQVLLLMHKIGRSAVYDKLFQFYHEKVEDVVTEYNKSKLSVAGSAPVAPPRAAPEKVKENKVEVSTPPTVPVPVKIPEPVASEIDDIGAFDDIDAMRTNLVKFYEKHDPVEIENIDDVIELGMDIGFAKLNANMETFYGESLITFLKALNKPKEKEKPKAKSKMRMYQETLEKQGKEEKSSEREKEKSVAPVVASKNPNPYNAKRDNVPPTPTATMSAVETQAKRVSNPTPTKTEAVTKKKSLNEPQAQAKKDSMFSNPGENQVIVLPNNNDSKFPSILNSVQNFDLSQLPPMDSRFPSVLNSNKNVDLSKVPPSPPFPDDDSEPPPPPLSENGSDSGSEKPPQAPPRGVKAAVESEASGKKTIRKLPDPPKDVRVSNSRKAPKTPAILPRPQKKEAHFTEVPVPAKEVSAPAAVEVKMLDNVQSAPSIVSPIAVLPNDANPNKPKVKKTAAAKKNESTADDPEESPFVPEPVAPSQVRLPSKPPKAVVEEVTEKELRDFYVKFDQGKLETIAQIMNVARTLGRVELNKKLMTFYGASLDTFQAEAKQSEDLERSSKKKAVNKNRGISNGRKPDTEPVVVVTTAPSPEITNAPKKPIRKAQATPAEELPPVVIEKKISYGDMSQLREDLVKFYERYDPGKLNVVDQILQLAKRIGRKALDEKLTELYGASLDQFSNRSPNDEFVSVAVPKQLPTVPKTFQMADEYEPPMTRQMSAPGGKRPPFGGVAIAGLTDMGKLGTASPASPTMVYEDQPVEMDVENNVVKMQNVKVQVLPQIPGMLPVAEIRGNLKKTGRDVNKSLSYKPSNRAKKSENSSNNAMYKLPAKKQDKIIKRYTQASLKLLTVNLEAPTSKDLSAAPASLPEGKRQNSARPKFGVDDVFGDVKTKNLTDGACENYRLDMSAKTMGLCQCGYPRVQHLGS